MIKYWIISCLYFGGIHVHRYGCASKLLQYKVPHITVPSFTCPAGHFDTTTRDNSENVQYVMNELLALKRRSLTPEQWTSLMPTLTDESSSLYIDLLVRVVSEWTSTTRDISNLPNTVFGMIEKIFDSIELNFGVVVTRAALGLITYSVGGLRADELEDILSLDDTVLDFVFQYHTPTVRRLPTHVWSRIRNALSGLLVERDEESLVWYHRQLQETAEARYAPEKTHLHALMGVFFSNSISEQKRKSRLVSEQPLTLNGTDVWVQGSLVNKRRLTESAYHLVESEQWSAAVAEICNVEVVCAAALCRQGVQLLQTAHKLRALTDHSQLLASDESDILDHYLRWLRQSMTTIAANPVMQIFLTCTKTQPLNSIARKHVLEIWQERVCPPVPRHAGTEAVTDAHPEEVCSDSTTVSVTIQYEQDIEGADQQVE
jgi:hypothetical protein